jgi:hypothetical protein
MIRHIRSIRVNESSTSTHQDKRTSTTSAAPLVR